MYGIDDNNQCGREKSYDIFFLSFHVKVAIHFPLELSSLYFNRLKYPSLFSFDTIPWCVLKMERKVALQMEVDRMVPPSV